MFDGAESGAKHRQADETLLTGRPGSCTGRPLLALIDAEPPRGRPDSIAAICGTQYPTEPAPGRSSAPLVRRCPPACATPVMFPANGPIGGLAMAARCFDGSCEGLPFKPGRCINPQDIAPPSEIQFRSRRVATRLPASVVSGYTTICGLQLFFCGLSPEIGHPRFTPACLAMSAPVTADINVATERMPLATFHCVGWSAWLTGGLIAHRKGILTFFGSTFLNGTAAGR